ncbi:MAG: serine/threonine-protein kinase [Acidobacteriota bacterium]|nr:MAG: serine/threonine-protein kinase [Acidobacteriota bacterium]
MEGTSISYFKIKSKIGQGGMGEVWEATDTKLNRRVALKLLPEVFAQDPQRMGRFQREAQMLASLNHPNIAAIHGLEEADGKKALVMELVEGEDLSDRISRSPLSLEEAVPIALQLAKALESAHDKGIIHRDLKPANVKLTAEGTVKVLDFGLAKAMENDPSVSPDMTQSPTLSVAATQAGIILGTAAYMSPEQARGKPVDRRADIWAFGVVLYEMLTGKKAFEGEDLSLTLASVMTRSPNWEALPGGLPGSIKGLLKRCLEKDPLKRLQSIGEARIILEAYLADPDEAESMEHRQVQGTQQRGSWTKYAAVGILCTLIAVVSTWILQLEEPRQKLSMEVALSGEGQLLLGYGPSVVLSPDGNMMAYVLGIGTNPDANRVYLRSLDMFDSSEIDGGNGGYHPFFSPDGKWVGFVTTGEMKKAAITGGAPLKLCNVSRSRGASWGQNGLIVFSPNPESELFSVSAAGGEPEKLTELEEGETSHRWPQFLPDGVHVLFTALNGADIREASLKVLNLDTKEQKTVHRGGTQGRYLKSGHLLFWREGSVFAAPFDLSAMELEALPAPVIQEVRGNPEGGAQFDASENGTLVYLKGGISSAREVDRRLTWFDRKGATSLASQVTGTYVWGHALSPNGRQLALGRITGGNLDIWVYDMERDTPSRLTFAEANEWYPVWSADGKDIYFTSARGGRTQIYRKSADGSSDTEQILESNSDQYVDSVSADGKYILFSRDESASNSDIWYAPLDGSGEAKVFLATQFSESFAKISPDSRWVAYVSNETGGNEIYVRPFPDAGGRWQISTDGGEFPIWGAGSTKLYYRSGADIMEVDLNVEGSGLRVSSPRISVSLEGNSQREFDVTSDGNRFLAVLDPEDSGNVGSEHEFRIARMSFDWFNNLEQLLLLGR